MANRIEVEINGKKNGIEYIGTLRGGNMIMIEVMDDRKLSKIAAAFEGVETIRKTNTNLPGVSETYEGYTELIDIRRNQNDGSVRMTLKRP